MHNPIDHDFLTIPPAMKVLASLLLFYAVLNITLHHGPLIYPFFDQPGLSIMSDPTFADLSYISKVVIMIPILIADFVIVFRRRYTTLICLLLLFFFIPQAVAALQYLLDNLPQTFTRDPFFLKPITELIILGLLIYIIPHYIHPTSHEDH